MPKFATSTLIIIMTSKTTAYTQLNIHTQNTYLYILFTHTFSVLIFEYFEYILNSLKLITMIRNKYIDYLNISYFYFINH